MNKTATLTNSVRGRYINKYVQAAKGRRVYDQFAMPISKDKEILQNSSSVTIPYVGGLTINAQVISEDVDISTQALKDATASITPTSRADAILDSEKLLLQAYTDYGEKRFELVGENMMETIEAVAIDAALAGSVVQRATARASLDAGTAGHRMSDAEIFKASNRLKEMRCPGATDADGLAVPSGYMAAMHPDAYYDLLAGGNVVSILQYQDKNILFSGEVGEIAGCRIIASPFAKVFGAAGADNGTVAAYTLSAASEALDEELSIGTATNVAIGRYLTIGTEETGSTFYPTNERVTHVSGTTTSVIVGSGPNGGMRFPHDSGAGVRNADSVYPVLFGGPNSLAKVYATEIGEYGEIVGPKREGYVDQFVSLGWKWYGAYAVINQNWLVRGEYSSSLDA